MAIDIKKLLPANISTEFWEDYCDAWSDELTLNKTELIDPKEYYYNTRYQNDIDELINICNTFGYTPDRSLDSSIEYLQKEVKYLNYRVKYKSTYTGYDIIFNILTYSGLVYNLYLDSNLILVRGLNLTEVISNLDSQDYSLPFIGFTPEFYYSTVLGATTLDEGETLDIGLTLDLPYQSFPTQHIAVEYTINQLITEDSTDYFITTDYLKYLENATNYNRKITEIPHIGFQFNFIADFSYYYNNLSLDADYSVPSLKFQCAYLDSPNVNNNQLSLDALTTYDRFDLDSIVPDQLDQDLISSTPSGNLENDFYKIILGDGGVGLPSIYFPDINNDLIGYWSFDELSGSTITDFTLNHYDGVMDGSYFREYNMLNQGMTFDPAWGVVNNINIDTDDKSFSFWARLQESTGIDAIFEFKQSSTIRMSLVYDSSANQLILNYFHGALYVSLFSASFVQDDDKHLFTINLINSTNTIELYVDNVLIDSRSTMTSYFSGLFTLTLGAVDGPSDFCRMSLDEFRLYNKILTTDERTFLFENQIGYIGGINEVISTTELINTRVEDTNWYIIAGRVVFNRTPEDDDLEEEVTITEFAIENSAGTKVFYAKLDAPAVFQKKYHLSYQVYLKK